MLTVVIQHRNPKANLLQAAPPSNILCLSCYRHQPPNPPRCLSLVSDYLTVERQHIFNNINRQSGQNNGRRRFKQSQNSRFSNPFLAVFGSCAIVCSNALSQLPTANWEYVIINKRKWLNAKQCMSCQFGTLQERKRNQPWPHERIQTVDANLSGLSQAPHFLAWWPS